MRQQHNKSTYSLYLMISIFFLYTAIVFWAIALPENCFSLTIQADNGKASWRSGKGQKKGQKKRTANLHAVISVDQPEWYDDNSYFPDLGMSLTKGYAPFGVFFEGWESTPRDSIVIWQWDFGAGTEDDEGGRYFSGFNGAHVYETPGTYTVTLKVQDKDGNWSSPASIEIEVMSSSEGNTFYVDSAIGDDSYSGLSPTVSGSDGPWKTATKAFQMMKRSSQHAPVEDWNYKPGDRILFKRGQAFELTKTVTLGHGMGTQGYYFGAYGDSSNDKPLIRWAGTTDFLGRHLLECGYGTGYVGFVDLQFNFYNPIGGLAEDPNQLEGLINAVSGAKNILFLRSDFFDPENGVFQFNGDNPENEPTAIFMAACTIQQPVTWETAVTFMYGGPGRLALLNNKFDKSGNHIAYLGSVHKAVISGNIWSRPAWGRLALRIMGGGFSDPGDNIYVANNLFLGWKDDAIGGSGRVGGAHGSVTDQYNMLLVQFGPGADRKHSLKDVIFERNIITNFKGGMQVAYGDNIIVRNNLFVTPSAQHCNGVRLSGLDRVHRPLQNVSVVGNTFLYNGDPAAMPSNKHQDMIIIYPWTDGPVDGHPEFGSKHQGITIKNNIFKSGNIINIRPIAFDTTQTSFDEYFIGNNIYHVPGTDTAQIFLNGDSYYSYETWCSTVGDTGSIVADPEFTSPVTVVTHDDGAPVSMAAGIAEAETYKAMLKLSSTSPAIDAGAPFPAKLYFDFENNQRPQGSGYDIGAYEYDNGLIAIPHR